MSEPYFLFRDHLAEEEGAVIEIPKDLSTKEALIDAYRSVGFPAYLHNNWDSLFDCLRDFSWIESRTIQIVHSDIPMSDDAAGQRAYLSLLADAVGDWRGDDAHQLEVVFPMGCKTAVEQLLHH